jgi:micrococcal nuclease
VRQRPPLAARRLLAALALAGLALAATAALAARVETGRVVWVTDGDTITVRISGAKEKVRLVGIDTPELDDVRDAWNRLAHDARAHLSKRLRGRTVALERDPESRNRDKFDRLLRYVVLDDGTDVGEEMVREGYARVYTRFPFARRARYDAAEREAKAAGRGRWALPSPRSGRVAP